MVPGVNWAIDIDEDVTPVGPLRECRGYLCTTCKWFITRIEFARNSHGTQEQRRARIANREIGRR